MARKALIEKAKKIPKFRVRQRNRCLIKGCGKARDFRRKFGVCGDHLLERTCEGKLPGVRPISW
jgi:small subunit ribosomal protein S14